jgi:alkanesulfonate monooxygenase SsuD/methylene tetrahydromethanopterin reductase-like flavin-dependent oxidoreductase (luciferase family)
MRLGVVMISRVHAGTPASALADRICGLGQAAESAGFDGVWSTDSVGRGSPTLDPLTMLAMLCGGTKRVELGTCVLQVPLRAPVELAHRAQTLSVLSGGRLRLGVGAGSTEKDFDVMGADYKARFKTLPAFLADMQKVWRGEAVHRLPLQTWPAPEGVPQVMLGAWRSEKWIKLACELDGWIASGLHSEWADLEEGMRRYRAAGGKRAILANVIAGFDDAGKARSLTGHQTITLTDSPEAARATLARIKAIGFDDVLLIPANGDVDSLRQFRDMV